MAKNKEASKEHLAKCTKKLVCTVCGNEKPVMAYRYRKYMEREEPYKCIHCKAPRGEKNANWQGGKVVLTCTRCGKQRTTNKYAAKATERHGRPYLCSKCHQTYYVKRNNDGKEKDWKNYLTETVICTKCKAIKAVTPYRKSKLATPYFCCNCAPSYHLMGEKNIRWRGGLSFLPYPTSWKEALKKTIRERDNRKCQICGDDQRKDFKLDVHHIDYDKNNIATNNLITLCRTCHIRTNNNREYWKTKLTGTVI